MEKIFFAAVFCGAGAFFVGAAAVAAGNVDDFLAGTGLG